MATRRPAAGRNPVRVDAETPRVRADVAQGGLGVAQAGIGLYLMARGDAVVGQDSHHAARRQ